MLKVSINGSGIDHMRPVGTLAYVGKVHIQLYGDIGVIQHALEHSGVAMQRHGLEGVGEIAVIRIGTHRNACRYTRLELRRFHAPLLARVVQKEFFIQIAPHGIEHHILAAAHRLAWFTDTLKKRCSTGFVQIQAIQQIERVAVNREGILPAIHHTQHTVFVRTPFGKAGKKFPHLFAIGVKDMRPIAVYQHAMCIRLIKGIAANMRAAVN